MRKEHHIEVRKSARYFTLGEPGPQIGDVWFVCHGYGQLASDFIEEFECIAEPRRLIVAPEALSRYYVATGPGFHSAEAKVGATWMTREDREAEIDDYVEYLDDLYGEIFAGIDRDTVRLTLVGFSQGGATAHRWLLRGNARFDRLVMWGSLPAGDADLARTAEIVRDVELKVVYGKRDQFADEQIIAGYQKTLTLNSIRYELISFNGGHRMDRGILCQLAGGLQDQAGGG